MAGSRSAVSPLKTGGGDSALLNAAILNCEKRSGKERREAQAGAEDRRGRQRTETQDTDPENIHTLLLPGEMCV